MSKYLSLYGKIWYAFLCAKLSPSTHTSEVTKEKVLLLYSNVKDFDIDIGALISFSIRHCLRGPFSRGLPHPSLICGLYCQSGVRWAGNEPVQQPLQLLDLCLITRYSVWQRGESQPCGLGFVIPNVPEEEETNTNFEDNKFKADEMSEDDEDAAPGASRSTKYMFNTKFQSLQRHIDARDRLEDRKLKRVAALKDHAFATQNTFNASLAETFARLNPTTADQFQFLSPQPLLVYTISDSDVEEVPPLAQPIQGSPLCFIAIFLTMRTLFVLSLGKSVHVFNVQLCVCHMSFCMC